MQTSSDVLDDSRTATNLFTRVTLPLLIWTLGVFAPAGLLGDDAESAAKKGQRTHLVMIVAERVYRTKETLPRFARQFLQQKFRVSFAFAEVHDRNRIRGLESLDTADVMLLSVRRRALPKAQLDAIRAFVSGGKPVVGIRTASHAFDLNKAKTSPGHDVWPEFDRDILGGHYHGHYADKGEKGASTFVRVAPRATDHPILAGIPRQEFPARSSLYMTRPLGPKATLLLIGRADDRKPSEPVAWTNINKHGGRVFYTSLGHPKDFEIPAVQKLLVNGIHWAAGLDAP